MRDVASPESPFGTGVPDHGGLIRTLLVDQRGTVLEGDADGPLPSSLDAWLPSLDPATLSGLWTAVHVAPGGRLRIDARTTDARSLALWMSAAGDGCYRVDIEDVGQDRSYRSRLEQRLVFERLIASLSSDLIHASASQIDSLIETALGRIGRLFGVDRAYLFRFSDDVLTHSNTHEWVDDGIGREAHNLQALPVTIFPWLMQELFDGRAVHVPVVSELPPEAEAERNEFMREGIQSIALVPFHTEGRPAGFIGFDSVRCQRHWPPEILLGLQLLGQMFANAFQAREMAERLTQLAFHDALTGLGNRRYLSERLESTMDRCRRESRQVAVVLVDLDDFKLVNDSYGRAVGDEVLKTAAQRLTQMLRAGDILARMGGDEFVLAVEIDGLASLSTLIERLFEVMLEPVELRGIGFAPRLSMGIAVFPLDADDPETLLRHADTAMYAAKLEGKNRHTFFTPEMTRASRESLCLRHELRMALQRDEIRPHYQPRVELPSMRVIGFEALARWHHPERGLLMPGQFLGLAQHGGMVGAIDLGALAHSIRHVRHWRQRHPDCRVSVNLDALALQDEGLIAQLESLLRSAADVAANLEIEITESSLMRDIGQASVALQRLRDAAPGLHVAIDDFGIGYSSLAYLGRLPVDTLKIDRSFINDLSGPTPRSARAIVQSIIALGHSLGLHVVAEGVETPAQARELCELGCQEAQGYLFSPAVAPDEAGHWLSRELPTYSAAG